MTNNEHISLNRGPWFSPHLSVGAEEADYPAAVLKASGEPSTWFRSNDS